MTAPADTAARPVVGGDKAAAPSRLRTAVRTAAGLARQVPFTVVLLVVIIAGAVTTGIALGPHDTVREQVATGLHSVITQGRWWTPLTSGLFANDLGELIVGLVVTAAFVGAAEKLMGTWRTVLAYLVTTYVGVYAGVGFQALAGWGNQFWVAHVIAHGSLDVTRPALGVLMAASAFTGVLWRRRIRVVLLLVTVMFVLYSGHPTDTYRLVAVLAGFVLGWALRPRTPLVHWVRSSHHETRVLMASLVAVSAIGPLVAALSATRFGVLSPLVALTGGDLLPDGGDARCDALNITPQCVNGFALHRIHDSRLLAVLVPVLLLLVVSYYLLRGSRVALWTAVAVNGAIAVWSAVYFGLLPSRTFPVGTAHLQAQYWRTSFALAASAIAPALVAIGLVVLRRHFAAAPRAGVASRVGRLTGARPSLLTGAIATISPDVQARTLVREGGSPLAHMATWAGNRYWIDDAGRVGVAYRVIGPVALTVGGPFGHETDFGAALARFARFCDDNGWHPVYYSVDEVLEPAFLEAGWHTLTVAEEAVIDLPTWTLSGNRNKDVRTAVNKAVRTGLTPVWTDWRSLSRLDQLQIADISEAWVADKALPEMSFTLGGLAELDDPDVRLMLAVDAEGRIEAVTSWMPIHHGGSLTGWTLDFMRRRPDSTNGVMEFLIAKTAERAQAEGLAELSLSGVPLARSAPNPSPSPLETALNAIGRMLEPHYGFNSLMRFKGKFHPRHRRLIMAYNDPSMLGAIGLALTRAYLPTLSLRQIMRLLRTR